MRDHISRKHAVECENHHSLRKYHGIPFLHPDLADLGASGVDLIVICTDDDREMRAQFTTPDVKIVLHHRARAVVDAFRLVYLRRTEFKACIRGMARRKRSVGGGFCDGH